MAPTKKKLTKTSYALYKHLKTRTNVIEMYEKWACVYGFSTTK